MKLSKERWYKGRNLVYTVCFSTLCLIGWTSVVTTIIDIAQGK